LAFRALVSCIELLLSGFIDLIQTASNISLKLMILTGISDVPFLKKINNAIYKILEISWLVLGFVS